MDIEKIIEAKEINQLLKEKEQLQRQLEDVKQQLKAFKKPDQELAEKAQVWDQIKALG